MQLRFFKLIFIPLFFLASNYLAAQTEGTRPNIIYIMTDDLGYADLSCYGRKDYTTPHLDKLASEGMKFMNAYSAAPVCTPTRTAFMTGRYPARTEIGLLEPWVPSKRDSSIGLPANKYSVAALLKKVGYETILIGKWHLGATASFLPQKNGFDYFFGIKTGAADYISHRGDGNKHDLYENDTHVYPKGYMTELFGEKVIQVLKQPRKNPFFLSIQFTAPHWPWQGPLDKPLPDSIPMSAKIMAANGTADTYKAMMKSLDDQVGKIMQVLSETGLSKNTIVIFTSDNGGEKFSDMGPYANRKMSLWEGGLRVPAFVRWPGKIKANTVTDQPVITMDWTATILSVAGAEPAKEFPLDGKDMLPVLLKNEKIPNRFFYWRIYQRAKQHAIFDGEWKYLKDEKGEYLFNITTDPGEKNDLKAKEPAIINRLKMKYDEWEKSVLPPVAL
jgi:arylsulfatase A-like enzyme